MDKITIETYNSMATQYDEETVEFWDLFPRTFFDKFIRLPGKKVLDVGSGPGRDGLILKQHGLDVTCLDASKAMIKMCSKRGLRTVLGDFNEMPFKDESFDLVWAYTSLLHTPKSSIEQPLNEVHRILRKGGSLGVGMIEGNFEGYRSSFGGQKKRWFSFYTTAELTTLFSKHGFVVTSFESFKPSTRNYLNFIVRKL